MNRARRYLTRFPARWAAPILFTLFLSACQSVEYVHGNIIKPEAVAQIEIGKTTSEEVDRLMGSPTTVNSFRQNRWLYITDRRFKGSRAVSRVEITFDDEGVVAKIDKNFGEEILAPAADGEEARSDAWWKFWSRKAAVETGVPPIAPPVEESPEMVSKKLPWWNIWGDEEAVNAKSYYARKKARRDGDIDDDEDAPGVAEAAAKGMWGSVSEWFEYKTNISEPETEFKPEEEGWWQEIWTSDPTAKDRPVVAGDEVPAEAEEATGDWWENEKKWWNDLNPFSGDDKGSAAGSP